MAPKKTLGIIGESGCGKSVTAQSILRIVPPPEISRGSIMLNREGKEGSTSPISTRFGQSVTLDPRQRRSR